MSLWFSGSPDRKGQPLYSVTVPLQLPCVVVSFLPLFGIPWKIAIAAMLLFVGAVAVQVIRAVFRPLQ